MSKVSRLKDALLDRLLDALESGAVVVDEETGQPLRVTPDSKLLTVALNTVKAMQGETDEAVTAKADNVSRFLARYQTEGRA